MRGEVLGPDDRAEILHALGAGRGIEHALDRVLEVGAGDDAAVGKARVAAQMEGEAGGVRRGFPRGREIGYEIDAGVAVAHQRIEDHLLEHPGFDVVADGRIERWDVRDRGKLEDHRAGRKLERRRTGTAPWKCEKQEHRDDTRDRFS
jgi:hypothetical protein